MNETEQLNEAIERLRQPGMTAGELAELLPAHLVAAYWERKGNEFFASEGIR